MEEDKLNINVPEAVENPLPVELPQEDLAAPLSPEIADKRAFKVKYGLDRILKTSKEEIFNRLSQGEEGNMRVEAAAEIDNRKRQQTEKVINYVVGQKGGPLSPAEALGITQIISNMNEKTDPSTVFEEAYGKQFMMNFDEMVNSNPDSAAAKLRREFPEYVFPKQEEHSAMITKREILNTLMEDVESTLKNQGWIPYGVDFAKGLVPGYTDAKLRNMADVGMFTGIGLGANLEEARKNYLRMPPKEMKAKLEADTANLKNDNPQLYVEFLRSMVGMTSDDVVLKSIILPLDVAGLGLGKAAVSGTRRGLQSMGVITRDTEKAMSDIAKAAADPNVSKSTIQAASGDLSSSAITRTVTNRVSEAGGHPRNTEQAVEALTHTFRADDDAIRANPGRLGQDIVNRIVESSETVQTSLMNAVRNIQKVDRLPEIMSNEVAVRAILENIKGTYKGLQNSVIDLSRPYREAVANTWHVDMFIGKNDGTYFATRKQAENFAEFHGLKDALISEGQNAKFTKRAVEEAKYSKNISDAQRIIEKNKSSIAQSEGTIRFYHGTTFKTSKGFSGKTFVTTDENYARNYHGNKNNVLYTDLTKDEAIARGLWDEVNDRPLSTGSIDDGAKILKPLDNAKEQIRLAEEYIVDQAAARKAFGQTVSVEQQGFGYYIKVTKPINETDKVIRDFIAETSNTKIPDSPLQRFLNGSLVGKYRTPEETLSLAERQNRLTTTYTPSVYFEVIKSNAQTLNSVVGARFGKGRKRRQEFERILKAGQEMKDPDSLDDVGGYFFKSPAELEEQYLRINDRLPDADEIAAYFEFKRGMEIDRVFRNIAEHRNQQRVGAETHAITTLDDTGKTVKSAEFSGVTRNKISAADDNILIMGDRIGEERVRSLQSMSVAERKEFQKQMDDGEYKLIELYAPENKPLTGFGSVSADNRVRYVLAKSTETRELEWNQIPRRGGGHMELDYDYYIKQAKVSHDDVGKRYWYEGDTTVMPIQIHSMGVKVAKHLNTVRKFLQEKNEQAARDYSNENLHIDWDTVHSWFRGTVDADGKRVPARLSLSEPIQVLKKNESIIGVDKELERRYQNFKNGMKEGSLARQQQVEYSSQRDAFDMKTISDVGTRRNPLYQINQAELVDPITTMNRGLARIAKSNFMDDYKTMSVEHWLKQAAPYLEATDSEIWHAPFFHYNNPKWKVNAPPEIKSRLETAWMHTQQLTGTASTNDALLHSYAQRAYDTLYEKFGTQGLVVDPSWMLPKLKDPFGFIRGVVFNAKMGLFNIPQFIVQAGNYSNILGIAGAKYATPGTLGAQLHFWSGVNSRPQIIAKLDDLASKMNVPGAAKWRPGEFKEAWETLHQTGFGNVGREVATIDNPMSEKVVLDSVGTFLDWGQYFFRQGEKNARYGAWYTAFKEFRDKNPLGRLTQEDVASIMQRADVLNLNMSRASSSALHSGALSIPTQFYTYQIRLMELMLSGVTSGRISQKETARLFATNALLYGIPMAGGLSGLPVADYMRRKSIENGYVVGDEFWSSLLMEGLPSMIGAVVTGGGDYQKGTFLDVGSRFGTKGLEFLGGLDRADKSLMDILGGAAWSVTKGTIEQSDGFRTAMMGLIRGDTDTFPITVEDIVDVFKEITTVNTAWRTYAAVQGGRWISKKEAYLADTTPAAALFSAVSGLKDQRITDINTMANSLKVQADYEKAIEKQFEQEFRRAVISDDDQMRDKFFRRAKAWLELGGYREDRISDLVHKQIRNNKSMIDKMNFDFYLKRGPNAGGEQQWNTLQRIEELKEKRGEK